MESVTVVGSKAGGGGQRKTLRIWNQVRVGEGKGVG